MLGTCAWRVSEGSWDPLNTYVGYAIDSSVGHSVRLLDIRSARRALVKDVTVVRFLTSSHPSVPAHSFRGCRPTQLVFTTTDEACLFVCPFVLNGRERFLDGRNTLINYPLLSDPSESLKGCGVHRNILVINAFILYNKWGAKRSFCLVKWHMAVPG